MESEEAAAFSQKVAHLLRRAIKLKERKSEMSPHGYRVARRKLEAALNRLLAQEATDPEAAKLLKLLTKQRPHLSSNDEVNWELTPFRSSPLLAQESKG